MPALEILIFGCAQLVLNAGFERITQGIVGVERLTRGPYFRCSEILVFPLDQLLGACLMGESKSMRYI